VGKLRERVHLENPVIDGLIILKWIVKKWKGGYGINWSDSEKEKLAGSCKCGNKLSGSTQCGEFLD
jgi:hypothetical protein